MGKCKDICEVPNKELFSKKASYKTHSYCRKCNIWVKEPTSREIIVTTPKYREVSIWKTKVTCPCCLNQCSGGPYGKSKSKPKPDYLKSYKELDLKKTPTRGTPDIKNNIEDLLERDTLGIIKAYDEMVFGLTPKNEVFDEIVELLRGYNSVTSKYDKNVTAEEQQRYQKWIIKQLDKYARKHKLGLFGMTEEEEKKESTKKVN